VNLGSEHDEKLTSVKTNMGRLAKSLYGYVCDHSIRCGVIITAT